MNLTVILWLSRKQKYLVSVAAADKFDGNLVLEDTAVIDGYSSYFSFPKRQSGYSGVATFCRNNCTPNFAQEGLSSSVICSQADMEALCEKVQSYDLTTLDSEGRVMITYHQIQIENQTKTLAVINVYCPRVDPEKPERHVFKMEFLHFLEAKAGALQKDGCSVVILGDLNIAHRTIDHCDPCNEEEFNSSEARQWLSSFLGNMNPSIGEPLFVDAYRYLHPEQKEAYTCWNTLTGARQTNYGTRIDYFLVDNSLLPSIESCDILADVFGSDHCPVSLCLKVNATPSSKLPPICTQLWPEFSGKQQKLLSFCQKGHSTVNLELTAQASNHPKRCKLTSNAPRQQSITSFFKTGQKSVVQEIDGCQGNLSGYARNFSEMSCEQNMETLVQKYDFAEKKEQCAMWKSVLRGPPKPPLCSGHQKLCVLRTVRKDGPNLGRQFFACAQPNGPTSNPDSRCDFFKWATVPKRSTLKNK